MTEIIGITDIPKYLDRFQFDLSQWPQSEGASDHLLGQLIVFTSCLGLSHIDAREELGIETVETPNTTDPRVLFDNILEQIAEAGFKDMRPDQDLIIDSHLFIPYVFPYVLKALDLAGLLTDAGLKSLAYQALDNVDATMDPNISKKITSKTRQGNDFLEQMVDSFRESLGKTKATRGLLGRQWLDYLSLSRNLFLTQDPAQQAEVIEGLRDWFKPEAVVTLKQANQMASKRLINEDPKLYRQRMITLEQHMAIIYQGLTS